MQEKVPVPAIRRNLHLSREIEVTTPGTLLIVVGTVPKNPEEIEGSFLCLLGWGYLKPDTIETGMDMVPMLELE
jgi:hypothetical protein